MNKIKELLGQVVGWIIGLFIGSMYLFGMYSLAVKDTYSTKQFIIGGVVFPYSIYIGSKELYKNLDTKEEIRQQNKKYDLDELASFLHEARGLPRMQDKVTLEKSITSNGSDIVYTYQITTMKNSNILKDSLQGLFASAKKQYCEAERYKDFDEMLHKQNVATVTKFFDKNNELIDQVSFNKSSCL